MDLPSLEEIEALHRKYAPTDELFDLVYTHCQIVWEIAEQIILSKQLSLDKDFIRAAALLHDIGAYQLLDPNTAFDEKNYIKHGILGYEILKRESLPDEICQVARRHTGVGLTVEDITNQNLPLPPFDYVAQDQAQRLIMYADKFHSKTPQFNSFESYSKFVSKYGTDKVGKFNKLAEEFGKPELESLAKKYNMSTL